MVKLGFWHHVHCLSYKKNVYGVLNDKTKRMDSKSITDMVEGERRRWSHADIEGDDALNIVEFQVEANNFTSFDRLKSHFLGFPPS